MPQRSASGTLIELNDGGVIHARALFCLRIDARHFAGDLDIGQSVEADLRRIANVDARHVVLAEIVRLDAQALEIGHLHDRHTWPDELMRIDQHVRHHAVKRRNDLRLRQLRFQLGGLGFSLIDLRLGNRHVLRRLVPAFNRSSRACATFTCACATPMRASAMRR